MNSDRRPRRFFSSIELLEARIAPATFVVTSMLDDNGADLTLREAVVEANKTVAADTITFLAGLTGTIDLDPAQNGIAISAALTIKGPGADKLTVSAAGTTRAFFITDRDINNDPDPTRQSPVAISNLAIIGGSGGTNGGAIVDFEPLTLTHVLLTNGGVNENGGGLWAETAGKVTITSSRILDNAGPLGGGGVWVSAAGGVTVSKTVISGNGAAGAAAEGGGAFLQSLGPVGSISVSDSIISKNSAGSSGGGLSLVTDGRKMVIKNSTVSENSADFFGGVENTHGALTVSGSSFYRNSAASGGALGSGASAIATITVTGSSFTGNMATDPAAFGGGAILHFADGPLKLLKSQFSRNSSAADGGALLVYSKTSATVSGSLFSGNSADDGGAIAFGNDFSGGTLTATGNSFLEIAPPTMAVRSSRKEAARSRLMAALFARM